jgi:hypothetical protein
MTGLLSALAFAAAAVLTPASAAGIDQDGGKVFYDGDQLITAKPTVLLAADRQAAIRGGYRHFIEFRARHALTYGHAYVVYGRLNERGDVVRRTVVGFHPRGATAVPWSIGHVVPVPGVYSPSDGDLEDEYIEARYAVLLTETEYNRMLPGIEKLTSRTTMWHALFYNCTAFVGDAAAATGLKPPSSNMYPADYINELKSLNSGRQFLSAPPERAVARTAVPSATARAAPVSRRQANAATEGSCEGCPR